MIIILSPAKTLDLESPVKSKQVTEPAYLKQSKQLINGLKKMAPHDISALMGISDKLGTLNHDRFQDWKLPFSLDNARPAILTFKGDVYTGFDVEQMNAKDLQYAQNHLRILSGLYGLLKPMDLMQAYRLEMGTQWKTDKFNDLYDFWGDRLSVDLNADINNSRNPALINLASNEYYKALKPKLIDADIVTPVFKDYKNGKYKIISFFAKKARGMMAASIIKRRIDKPELIKDIIVDGYKYSANDSSDKQWFFTRKH